MCLRKNTFANGDGDMAEFEHDVSPVPRDCCPPLVVGRGLIAQAFDEDSVDEDVENDVDGGTFWIVAVVVAFLLGGGFRAIATLLAQAH